MSSQEKIFRPRNFAEIFRQLRLRAQLTTLQMARVVNYSQSMIQTYETVTINPSIKLLVHYLEGLSLEMRISNDGITIYDPKTEETILDNWSLDYIR